jgi:hypothetical protein
MKIGSWFLVRGSWFGIFQLYACIGIAFAASSADALTLPKDGWVTWTIFTVDTAPNWCCFDGPDWNTRPGSCDLDSRNHGYGSRGDDDTVSQMRIYAKAEAGKLTALRSYAPSCKVTTKSTLQDLGELPVADSLQWLNAHLQPRGKLTADVLAAIAVHAGSAAEDKLVSLAKADSSRETRKDALFWLGQVRGATGAARIRPFLLGDADAKVREHAAFAYSQSSAPDRGPALIEQGQSDASPHVRSQAWFWLAQTGARETEAAIAAALRKEPKRNVRHQAIFALSQLPKARAVKALIAVIEDRGLAMEERKQGLFWLGQDASPEAIAYLDKVL